MREKKNNSEKFSVRHFQILALAGLLAACVFPGLTLGQPTNYVDGATIDTSNPPTDGANILGGNNGVTWDTSNVSTIDGNMTFSGSNTVTLAGADGTINGNLSVTGDDVNGTLRQTNNSLTITGNISASGTNQSLIFTGNGGVAVGGTADGNINLGTLGTNTITGAIGSNAETTITVAANLTANGAVGDTTGTTSTTFTGDGTVTVGEDGSVNGNVAFNGTRTNTINGTIGGLAETTVTVAENLTTNGAVGNATGTTSTTFTGKGDMTVGEDGSVNGNVAFNGTGTNTINGTIGGQAATTVTVADNLTVGSALNSNNLITFAGAGNTTINNTVDGQVTYSNTGTNEFNGAIGSNEITTVTFAPEGSGTQTNNILAQIGSTDSANITTLIVNTGASISQDTTQQVIGNVKFQIADDASAAVGNINGETNAANITISGLLTAYSVTGTANVVAGATEGALTITQALGDGTDLTIGADDAAQTMTVNVTNSTGNVSVTAADNAVLNQSGNIAGTFNFANNSELGSNLGTLADGAILNYSGQGTGNTTLANTADTSTATINNTHTATATEGFLVVSSTGASSTTDFVTGENALTRILATGDGTADANTINNITGAGQAQILSLGANNTTNVRDDGTALFSKDASAIGAANTLNIFDGTVTFDAGIDSAYVAGITDFNIDSTDGLSNLNIQGAELTFTTDLDVNIVNNNVVFNSASGMILNGELNLSGNEGAGALLIETGFIRANVVNVNDQTKLDGNFYLAAAGTETGLNAALLNVNDTLEVLGDFTVVDASTEANPLLVFDSGADYANGGAAIITSGNIVIPEDTYFTVNNADLIANPDAAKASFTVVASESGNPVDGWGNLALAGGNGKDADGGSMFYNETTGVYSYRNSAYVDDSIANTSGFAQDYVSSVYHFNGDLADALGSGSDQELVLAMGNTLNAALLMVNNPLDPIFRNNNNIPVGTGTSMTTGSGNPHNFGLWFMPNLSQRSIDGDLSLGYGDFEIRNYGGMLGADARVSDYLLLGLFVGIDHAKLQSDFQRVKGNGLQLGIYSHAYLPGNVGLNIGLAHTWYDFDASRDVFSIGQPQASQSISSEFDGKVLFAELELNKTIYLHRSWFLRPGLGYTYIGAKLDSYQELSNTIYDDFNLAQSVDKTRFGLHLLRVGTELGFALENASVIGRAYYVYNAGDRQPSTSAGFAAFPDAPAFMLQGNLFDKNMANLGLSVNATVGKGMRVAFDYNTLIGNNVNHSIYLTFKYQW